jgi:hypothetical protein
MKRRSFLKAGGAGLANAALSSGLLSWVPRAHAATIKRMLYITSGTKTMPDGVAVFFKGYSSGTARLDVPAAAILCQEGDTLEITVVNRVSATHNLVIGGLKPGDAPLASTGDIAPGGSKTLSLTLAVGRAGSYLFYDDVTSYNRLLGLHGALAVMPAGRSDQLYPGSPTFVQQYTWIFNDIDPAMHTAVQRGTSIPSNLVPRYFTINGLSSRPAGAPGARDPNVDAQYDPRTRLVGRVGERALVRMLNAGLASHAVHGHGNHVEWLTNNGTIRPVWKKDSLYLRNNLGKIDAIYPFEPPPDAHPPVYTGMYPMHLHDEMSQTAGGGLYLFGAQTEIEFI